MRFLSANLVFPISSAPLINGVVVVDENNRIADVLPENSPHLPESVEKYEGIICPGFVNAHCHLELSHMKGVLPEGTGLDGFIGGIVAQREAELEKIQRAQITADNAMWEAGIQAVGDICNNDSTIATKQRSRIRYHSFIELLGINPSGAELTMQRGIDLAERYREKNLAASIVPHASYSVSANLLSLISEEAYMNEAPISIHNQETKSEDEMFLRGTGALLKKLTSLGVPMQFFVPTKLTALRSILPLLLQSKPILLVHNTFTTAEDMAWANAQNDTLFWCTCPSANLYIESQVPDVTTWLACGSTICVGTDSLASNHQLSVLEELRLLTQHCPNISFDNLLRIATLNGARALGLEKETGTLEKSKMPGVLLLENIDLECPSISSTTTVKRLV
jgi:cytosine/adenosine deaminase-related metal-dependent hydrolase